MKKIILLSSAALLLAGCDFSNGGSTNKSTNSYSSIESKHSYDEVADKFIDWNDIFSKTDNLYYVYFYSPTCSHCMEFKDTIIPYALETTKSIYFCEESSKFNYGDDLSKTIGVISCADFYIKGFPSLAIFENNTVIDNMSGTTAISNTLNL